MNYLKFQILNFKSVHGAAALTTALLLGGIIVEIGLVGAFLFYLLNRTSYGIRLSSEAYAAAETGIAEGITRLGLDPCFSGSIPTIMIGTEGLRADVTMSFPSGSCRTNPIIVMRTVTAWGWKIVAKRRKLQATVEVNEATGSVRLLTLREASLP